MSAKPKPQSTELDHIRDTLTDLVRSVGEANSDIKQLDSKVDDVKDHLSEHDKRFDQLEHSTNERFDQLEHSTNERFDQLELLIRQLIPKN